MSVGIGSSVSAVRNGSSVSAVGKESSISAVVNGSSISASASFPKWVDRLPIDVSAYLLKSIWSIVDEYRDLVWLCIAPFRFESKSRLQRFCQATRPLVQGAIICIDPEMEDVDNENDRLNEIDIQNIFIANEFKAEELVVIKYPNSHGDYSKQMNMAIQNVQNRCHFFWELQTRELVKPVTEQQRQEFYCYILNSMYDSFYMINHRVTLFRVHCSNESHWICYGAAHSYIQAKTGYYNNQPLPMLQYCSEGKPRKQQLHELAVLTRDVNAGNKDQSRAHFYIANLFNNLGNHNAAIKYYYKIVQDLAAWSQEKYISCSEMVSILRDPQEICHLIDRAFFFDPTRYEILSRASQQAMNIQRPSIGRYVLKCCKERFEMVNQDDISKLHLVVPWRGNPNLLEQKEHTRTYLFAVEEALGFKNVLWNVSDCALRNQDYRYAYAALNSGFFEQPCSIYAFSLPKEERSSWATRALLCLQQMYPCNEFPIVPHLFDSRLAK